MPKGSSVCFTNGVGAYGPMPSAGAFYVSETGLLGLTVLLARYMVHGVCSLLDFKYRVANQLRELGPSGIRCNAVAPGPVRTRFATDLWADGAEEAQEKAQWLQRIGEPDDISGAVAFVCSDDAAWYTGQTLSVDGGMYSRL